jgi:molecular chaperone HscB
VTTDPFDTLGLEPTFALDPELIDRRVRELGRALHPDRHATATAGERRQALGRSIDVNEAGRVSRDPIRRAEVLRQRLLGAAQEALDEAVASKAPPELLLEMMELRESLAAAKAARDLGKVMRLAAPVRDREERVLRAIDERFQGALDGTRLDLGALDRDIGELRYLRRFLDEVSLIEDELG